VQVERPIGHDEMVQRLWRAAAQERLPHALCFEGPSGIGKFVAALWFSQGLLCVHGPGEPCGSCGPCKRVLSGGTRGNHPDLLRIDPIEEGSEHIKVARIAPRSDEEGGDGGEESVESFLMLVPAEARLRIVLVREAQRMNAPAQSALLKTLEEPRPRTLLVLETHRPLALLPTLRSRCVRLRFPAPERARCAQVLEARGLPAEEAEHLARLAQGSIGAALALRERAAPAALALLEALQRGATRADEAAEALGELPGEFPGETPLAQARERARSFLELALALALDALRIAVGVAPETLSHGPEALRLAGAGERRLASALEALARARADVDRNLAPQATVERGLHPLEGLAALGSDVRRN
jgi:DNA polymerase-3 subunit delta'